jgi:hypothetical protein
MSAINQIQVANVAIANVKGTEYSFAIPPGAKHIRFGLRPNADSADLYWYMTSIGNADITGQSLVPYRTIGHSDLPRQEYFYGAALGGQTIYFQASHATEVVEISYIIDP